MEKTIFLQYPFERFVKAMRSIISINGPKCTKSGEDILFKEYGDTLFFTVRKHNYFLPILHIVIRHKNIPHPMRIHKQTHKVNAPYYK